VDRINLNKSHRLGFFNNEEYEYLGSCSGYRCYSCDEEDLHWNDLSTYVYVDFTDPDNSNKRGHEKRVCELQLRQTKKNVYEVEMMVIDNQYQGLGLSATFYAYLLRKLRITIKAGSSQSPGGISIWTKLSKRRDVIVYGKTPSGRPIMMVEECGEMQPINGKFEAYDGDRQFEMYAVRAA